MGADRRVTAEQVTAGYEALFDPIMRAAHRAVLEYVRLTRDDQWPTPAIVTVFAGLYKVPAANLGAFFGLLSYAEGGRTVWVDAVRGPTHPALAQQLATREQAKAFGFILCACEGERPGQLQ